MTIREDVELVERAARCGPTGSFAPAETAALERLLKASLAYVTYDTRFHEMFGMGKVQFVTGNLLAAVEREAGR